MKKFFLLLISILMCLPSFCQVFVVGEYEAYGGPYKVTVDNLQGKDVVKVQVYTYDPVVEEVELVISIKKISEFRDLLYLVRNKYAEWSEIADKNGVLEFNKEISSGMLNIGSVWTHDSSIYSCAVVWYSAGYAIISNTKMAIIAGSNHAVNTDQNISASWAILFMSIEEIESLIDLLEEEKIKNALTQMEKIDELFQ